MTHQLAGTPAPVAPAPQAPFLGLSTLWVQITGTWCNLECRHCINASGPRAPGRGGLGEGVGGVAPPEGARAPAHRDRHRDHGGRASRAGRHARTIPRLPPRAGGRAAAPQDHAGVRPGPAARERGGAAHRGGPRRLRPLDAPRRGRAGGRAGRRLPRPEPGWRPGGAALPREPGRVLPARAPLPPGVRDLSPDGDDVPEQLGEYRGIAVLGGVYSNALALEATLADARARGVEAVFCLGDMGGFGPHPDRVFPLLREHGVLSIQGNYDESLPSGRTDSGCGYTDPRDNHYAP